MSVTRQEILRSAGKLFSQRGFPAVSIQDIADDCRIAKGSVYNYFNSKEELFFEVFEQFQNRYFEEAERISRLPGLTEREHFLRQLVFRFQYFIEHQHVVVEYNELAIRQEATFIPVRRRARGRMLNWHKECLLKVYGAEIEPYVWDLVFIYKALLKEYLHWLTHEPGPLSVEETAAFVLARMDVLAAQMLEAGARPLLTADSFARYADWGKDGQYADGREAAGRLLDRLAAIVEGGTTGSAQQREWLEQIRLLRAEAEREKPNGPLVRALLAYLEREDELKSAVAQLKNVWSADAVI